MAAFCQSSSGSAAASLSQSPTSGAVAISWYMPASMDIDSARFSPPPCGIITASSTLSIAWACSIASSLRPSSARFSKAELADIGAVSVKRETAHNPNSTGGGSYFRIWSKPRPMATPIEMPSAIPVERLPETVPITAPRATPLAMPSPRLDQVLFLRSVSFSAMSGLLSKVPFRCRDRDVKGMGRSRGDCAPREAGPSGLCLIADRASLGDCAAGVGYCLSLEGQDGVGDLLAVARLLNVGDLAAAAVGDARFGELLGRDGVVGLDVRRPHDALHEEVTNFVVHAHLLMALDHEVAVGQGLGDDDGDVGGELLVAVDRARAADAHGAGGGAAAGGADVHARNMRAEQRAERRADVGVLARVALARRGVRNLGAVVDGDDDREDVADLVGALVLEEAAGVGC